MSKTEARTPAWHPVGYSAPVVEALQALASGTADAGQQSLALDWIIKDCAGAYEVSFRSDCDGGDRETAFAEGRRFVGLQVVKMLAMTGKMIGALRNQNG